MFDKIILLLYNVLFFIAPLIMTKNTSELFEFNKIIFIYIITVLVGFFWLIKMVVNKKIILKKTPLDIPILIFFLTQLISTFTSIDQHTSIFGYYGRFNGSLLSTLSYIILYYGFVSNSINLKTILKTILFSSLIVIFWAIPGHYGHDLTCLVFTGKFNNACWDNETMAFRPELRAFSTLGQPNWLGAYLAITFFIGIYFLINNKGNSKYFILNTLYLFLNFSMILMTRSRSAIGAVIVGLILFIGYYWLYIKTNFKRIIIILFLITTIPLFLFKTGEDRIDKILNFQNRPAESISISYHLPPKPLLNITESFDIRKIVWEGAWKLALKYPFFGTGVETFAYSYYLVRPVAHNLTSEWDFVYNKAHNEYFNYLATTGFIGLISYLIIIICFIFYCWKISNFKFLISNQFLIFKSKFQNKTTMKQLNNETMNEKGRSRSTPTISLLIVCLSISYTTILITNFFGFSTTNIQLFFFLIPALVFSLNSLPPTTYPLQPNKLTNNQKVIIFLILSLTIYLLFSISVYYLADINYAYGQNYAKPKINDQQKAAFYFEKAIKLRNEPNYIDRFSGSLAYLSVLAAMQNEKEISNKVALLADSYNQKNILEYPNNIFYLKTRAKNMYYFYQITSDDKELIEGIETLKKAKLLSPTDPKIPYTLALYYSLLYDSAKVDSDKQNYQKLSLDEITKAIKLKSNYRDAYLFKGQLLKKYSLIDEAKSVFQFILDNFNSSDPEVLKELQ